MDIPKLSITNFLTIGRAELELDGRGLLLIQGENEDDTSAKSNGAGKSSIVDALCWVLYGTTAREVSGDDVVNETAKKDCEVGVTLVDGATAYLISRYRKHATRKNQLIVHEVPATGTVVDLSKGTDKETQEVVNKIMGCSLDVFIGAIYAGQEKMPDLPGMTDKQLKLLIEEAAGVEELAEAYKEAAKRSLVVEKQHIAAQTTLKALGERLGLLNAELTAYQTSHAVFEGERKVRAKDELAKIKPLQEQVAATEADIATFDEPQLIARQAELEASLAKNDEQKAAQRKLAERLHAASTAVTRLHTQTSGKKDTHASQVKALEAIDSQVGQPCAECGKAYCAHDLESVKETRQKQIGTTKDELLTMARSYKEALAAQAAIQVEIDTFTAGLTDVSAAVAEMTAIRSNLSTIATLRKGVEANLRDIEAVKVKAKGCLTEANTWTKAVEGKQVEITGAESAILVAEVTCGTLETQAELYANAVKVFGPAGVRAHILDTVTPFLNEKTGEYLGALSDGNIHAVWSTLSKTAKGDLKEKFNIEVTNDKGGKTFKAISGGEKRKVRIATAMALQDMVATRATKPINLFMADEIDHALDEPGLERLMTVLDKKAKERGTVLVVSHNSLSDWIDNVILVKKSGGVSSVTGATQRGF